MKIIENTCLKKKEKTCHLFYSGWVLQVGIFRSLADPRILAALAPFSEVCRCALTYTVDVGNIMKFIINGEATGPRTRGTKNARRNRLDTDFRMWVKWITCRPPSFHCVSRLKCHSGLTTPANHTSNRPLKWPKCLKFPTHISWSDVSWSWCTLQTVWDCQGRGSPMFRCSSLHPAQIPGRCTYLHCHTVPDNFPVSVNTCAHCSQSGQIQRLCSMSPWDLFVWGLMKIDLDCEDRFVDLVPLSIMKHQWPMIETSGMTGEAPGASTASLNVLPVSWSCQGSDWSWSKSNMVNIHRRIYKSHKCITI